MKKSLRFLLICFCLEASAQFSSPDRTNFASPPKVDYPETYFHFIDGNVDKEGITKDLEAIAEAGISGVQFFHGGNFGGSWPAVREKVYCLSEKWEDVLAHTAREAQRLGLKFTMQNCPGWSMAGGPWITPENSMRIITYKRTDLSGGKTVKTVLPLDSMYYGGKRDYRDLFVLAFKRPNGDKPSPIVPSKVKCDTVEKQLLEILSGDKASKPLSFPAGGNLEFDVLFPTDTVIRTLVMDNPAVLNYYRCYEPEIRIKIQAKRSDGIFTNVLDAQVPAGAWQDPAQTMTFALNLTRTSVLHVSISHPHKLDISTFHFLTAARKNCWEGQAGWDLRKIPYDTEHPSQDRSSYIPVDAVIDITEFMGSDGTLNWEAPSGDWVVLRIGHCSNLKTNGPAPLEAVGLECDKLCCQGADAQFDGYIGKYASGAVNGLLDGMLLDSWECFTQTWSRDMEEQFQNITGYGLRKWVPALLGYVIGSPELTFRFLRDWRYTINHLLVENFYHRLSDRARSMGLHIQYETSGGDVYPSDIMEYYKYADIPMTEFWHNDTSSEFVGSINFKPVRPAASAGHLYGKTRISAEAFTSGWFTWNEHLWQLKENANRHLAGGVTHLVFHTYTHNPMADSLRPGTSFGTCIGTPFLRGQTWWRFMPSFTKYFARCTYMLECGIPSNNVLWYLGDAVDHKPDQRPSYMEGYNYDYCNYDILINRLKVKNGHIITPEGLSYDLLWYPSVEVISPETVNRLYELVKQGAVLVTDHPGGLATLMTYDREKFRSDSLQLFSVDGMHKVGKGRVYVGTDIVDALHSEGIGEDVKNADVDWIHRKTDGADWYFVAAKEGKGYKGKIDFRNTGKVEVWNPLDGSVTEIPSVQSDGRTVIDVDLPRCGSLFVLFDHRADASQVKTENNSSIMAVDGKWKVSFPGGWGMPESIMIDSLVAWKDMDVSDEGKSFSGTATYFRKIHIPDIQTGGRYLLSLGKVDMVAVVKVNGRQFDPLWTFPFEVDITDAVVQGDNDIEVEVTSGWFNRLVYDAANPSSSRTWTIDGPSANSSYVPTGLMGPVVLYSKN